MDAEIRSDRKFVGRVLVTIGFVVLTALILLLLYFAFGVLLLIFAASLIAIFLRGLAEILGRYVRIGQGWLVLIVSVLLIAILAGSVALLAPSVAEEARHLREELPQSAEKTAAYISQFGWGQALIEQLPSTDVIRESIGTSALLRGVGGVFTSTIGMMGNFFITLLLAVYLAIEPRFYIEGFKKLFPIKQRDRVGEVLHTIGETLEWWMIGKVASMLFIGILTWIGLSLLGIKLALALGLLAGLLSFIPNFGPIVSAIPAILIAFIASPVTALWVVGLYIGVQLIESNVVTPLIERETVELPPGLTVVFQVGMAVLVGGLGLILATPMLAAIMVFVQMVYIQDVLGDKHVEVEEKGLEEEAVPSS